MNGTSRKSGSTGYTMPITRTITIGMRGKMRLTGAGSKKNTKLTLPSNGSTTNGRKIIGGGVISTQIMTITTITIGTRVN